LLAGEARFVGRDEVEVAGERHKAKRFVVATGSRPATIPGFEVDGERIIDSTGALDLTGGVPERLLVIGAGAIGLEFADVYSALGSQVTVVEMLPQIAGATDPDAAKELRKALEKRGIEIHTDTKVAGQETKDGAVAVTVEAKDGVRTVTARSEERRVGKGCRDGQNSS